MAFPADLVLLRHGQSEGNLAHRRARQGDHGAFTEAFRARHSATWRLTPEGYAEAVRAGGFLREAFPDGFDVHLVSPYVRTLETAAALGLAHARWTVEPQLRERSWGVLDTEPNRASGPFTATMQRRSSAPYFWEAPDGESLAGVAERVRPVLAGLAGHASALLVCHGEVMTCVRAIVDPWWGRWLATTPWADDPAVVLRNCEVLHFTRRAPHDPAAPLTPAYGWLRRVEAGQADGRMGEWVPLAAADPVTTADLAALAQRVAGASPDD